MAQGVREWGRKEGRSGEKKMVGKRKKEVGEGKKEKEMGGRKGGRGGCGSQPTSEVRGEAFVRSQIYCGQFSIMASEARAGEEEEGEQHLLLHLPPFSSIPTTRFPCKQENHWIKEQG